MKDIFEHLQKIENEIDFGTLNTTKFNKDFIINCPYKNCEIDSLEANVYKVLVIVFVLLTITVIIFFLIRFFTSEFYYKNYLKSLK